MSKSHSHPDYCDVLVLEYQLFISECPSMAKKPRKPHSRRFPGPALSLATEPIEHKPVPTWSPNIFPGVHPFRPTGRQNTYTIGVCSFPTAAAALVELPRCERGRHFCYGARKICEEPCHPRFRNSALQQNNAGVKWSEPTYRAQTLRSMKVPFEAASFPTGAASLLQTSFGRNEARFSPWQFLSSLSNRRSSRFMGSSPPQGVQHKTTALPNNSILSVSDDQEYQLHFEAFISLLFDRIIIQRFNC